MAWMRRRVRSPQGPPSQIGSYFLYMINRIIRAAWLGIRSHELGSLFVFVMGLLVTGMVFYHRTEGWGLLDAFYFSAMTLTTVSYGDFYPTTTTSKLFTVGYVFLGLGAILGFVDAVTRHLIHENPMFKFSSRACQNALREAEECGRACGCSDGEACACREGEKKEAH